MKLKKILLPLLGGAMAVSALAANGECTLGINGTQSISGTNYISSLSLTGFNYGDHEVGQTFSVAATTGTLKLKGVAISTITVTVQPVGNFQGLTSANFTATATGDTAKNLTLDLTDTPPQVWGTNFQCNNTLSGKSYTVSISATNQKFTQQGDLAGTQFIVTAYVQS